MLTIRVTAQLKLMEKIYEENWMREIWLASVVPRKNTEQYLKVNGSCT